MNEQQKSELATIINGIVVNNKMADKAHGEGDYKNLRLWMDAVEESERVLEKEFGIVLPARARSNKAA